MSSTIVSPGPTGLLSGTRITVWSSLLVLARRAEKTGRPVARHSATFHRDNVNGAVGVFFRISVNALAPQLPAGFAHERRLFVSKGIQVQVELQLPDNIG